MKKYLISGFNTVQDVKLEVGTYTLVAYVKSMHGDVYTFALGDGTDWEEFSIDVIQGQLCKVWLTFTIDKKVTKFKPIANNFTEELPVYVTDLQLTRGNIPVESGASPFDIDQILNDLHDEIDAIEDFTEGAFLDGLLSREEKTQLRASLDSIGSIVESVKGSYNKLLDNPFIHENTMNNITARYYDFIASWISDGDPRGLKPVILWIVNGDNIISQNERDKKDRALNAFNDALYEYNQAEKEVYNDVGENSIAPIIDENGMWAFWSTELQEFIPSEFSAIGDDGHSPEIRDGYWWEWNPAINDYQNTGVKAEGKDGKDGKDGEDGKDGIDGEPPKIVNGYPKTQYAIGDSKTIYPISGWGMAIIDVTESKPYLWSRQEIKYDSGDTLYTGYLMLTNITPIPYMAGEWDMRVAYTRNDKSYPIVTYKKGTNNRPLYYYPKKEDVIEYVRFVKPDVNYSSTWYNQNDLVWYENDGSNGDPVCPLGIFKSKYNNNRYLPTTSSWWDNVTADYAPNGVEGQKLWEFADGMELIITDALMANFGKIASAVFSGDHMISQFGENQLGNQTSNYKDFGKVDENENPLFTPNIDIDFLKGVLKALEVDIRGTITATSGKIGNWNIVGGGLYSDYSTTASIKIEQSGGKFLRINEYTTSPMLSIRADNSTALSIYTQGGVGGVGISIAAQAGATAIQSFGSHFFVQRNTEKWNAPGILMIAQRILNNLSGTSNVYKQKWMIEPLKNTYIYRSGRNIELRHNIGHTDYVAYILINAGSAAVDSVSHTSEKSTFNISGNYAETHEITIVMIGRNKI